MDNKNRIVIISDNLAAKEALMKKINLLRKGDAVESYNYINAVNMLSSSVPELILLYADAYHSRCFEVLQDIKSTPEFDTVPVLLVCQEPEQDFILNAFDAGISDYISINAQSSEFLIRIIWSLQKKNLLKRHKNCLEQLVDLDVLWSNSFFYKEKFVDSVFKSIIKKACSQNKECALMIMSADIDCKHKLSAGLLANILKETLRKTDIVGIKDEDKFYILLDETDMNNAEAVFNRVQSELLDEYSVSAGVAVIDVEGWEKAETNAKKALQDALFNKQSIVFFNKNGMKANENASEEAEMTSPNKNFKLFKQSFIKKLNNVITPVFYQVQKMYEDKLFETDIEQTTDEGKSIFCLSSKNTQSTLTITYPGFSKINIKTEHQTVEKKQANSISLKLPELDNMELTKILEQFIQEYRDISGN